MIHRLLRRSRPLNRIQYLEIFPNSRVNFSSQTQKTPKEEVKTNSDRRPTNSGANHFFSEAKKVTEDYGGKIFEKIKGSAQKAADQTKEKLNGSQESQRASGSQNNFSSISSFFNSPILKNVTGSLKEAKKNIIDQNALSYGGITSKSYRDKIRQQRLKGFSSSSKAAEDNTAEVDPNAGANVVLHKDSKWKEAWSNFKDKNPIIQGVFSMRRRYEESDNVFVNTSRVLADRFRDIFGSVMEENEHAITLAELKYLDPSFELEKFMKETREFMIPEVLEAYVDWNPKELKQWCSDAVFSVLEAARHPISQQGHSVKGKILDLRNVELVMAKMMEDTPLLILSFKTQQTEVVRDRNNELVAGSEDGVNDVYYIWALTKDVENVNPLTKGWKIAEFAIQGVRESY